MMQQQVSNSSEVQKIKLSCLQTIDCKTSEWIHKALSRVRRVEGLLLSSKIDFRKFSTRYETTKADLVAFDRRTQCKIPRNKHIE
jgi:hypothetical protein